MKAFSNYRDIRITFYASRESWIADLRPLGLVPERPHFNTKAEATKVAKAAFGRWLNQDDDDGMVAPKPEISVGECFDRFLKKSIERAGNPDERFTWGSYQNHVDHCNRLRGPIVDGARLEKMMLTRVSKDVAEAVWKAIRETVSPRTTSDRYLVFQQAIRLSYKQGYICTNPCDLAEIARPNLEEAQIERTIKKVAKVSFQTLALITAHCPPVDRLKIIFAASTGLRQGEMVALKVYREKHPFDGGIGSDNRKICVRTAMKQGRSHRDR